MEMEQNKEAVLSPDQPCIMYFCSHHKTKSRADMPSLSSLSAQSLFLTLKA